ncbi:MAG: adenylate/guanylate cyclase domain-containing protein [Cytophagales bacterium]|nr:adenylate/guanylate cyclase domain-containing protein [Cytophagales bacterium]
MKRKIRTHQAVYFAVMSPHFKRNLARVLPFGAIWLVISLFTTLSDLTQSWDQNLNLSADVEMTLPVIIFASFASFLVGMLVGYLEMVKWQGRFRHLSFLRGLFIKLMLYLLIMVVIVAMFYPVAVSLGSEFSVFDQETMEITGRFFLSMTFLNTLIELGFSLMISLIYAGFSEHVGHQFLQKLVTGKYHNAQEEHRIFMFLDMNESTTFAEKLGHIKYFDLLQDYYETMTDPIIRYEGEVYQYVGDEVVVTWKASEDTARNNCIACFFGIKDNLNKQASKFQEKYGVVPHFKAGIHIGKVTTGKIGSLKKEIVFTGDVLNAAARIQGMCKTYQRPLIVSREIIDAMEDASSLQLESLGTTQLRGREEPAELFAISRTAVSPSA